MPLESWDEAIGCGANEDVSVLLPRYDAAPRPYWLRDWQRGFGGFTKVHEYVVDEEVKRMYSVAYVIPRLKMRAHVVLYSDVKDPI